MLTMLSTFTASASCCEPGFSDGDVSDCGACDSVVSDGDLVARTAVKEGQRFGCRLLRIKLPASCSQGSSDTEHSVLYILLSRTSTIAVPSTGCCDSKTSQKQNNGKK